MLFRDFYKKLKNAMGDTEFKKLPPVKGGPYQKIFMLMTLSCNDKSMGNCNAEFNRELKPRINDIFKALKNDLENLKVSLQELKQELKDTESLVNDEEILANIKNLKKTKTTVCSPQDFYYTFNFNDILDILTNDKNRTVIDSIFKVTEVIPEDSLKVTINCKDINDNGGRIIYDCLILIDNFIGNLNKDIDKINKDINIDKTYDVRRYYKYFGVSLKNYLPDYSDFEDWQIAEYVKYLFFWKDYESKSMTFKDYCIKSKASINKFAKKITPHLVSHPYFIDVINNLPDEQKWKIYEEFHEELKGEIDSLDFLGEKLAALLKKIIDEATNEDLQILEKLWKKEEDNFLEMVLYPILHDLFDPNSATDFSRYSFCLKIRNEKNAVVIDNHPDTFLDNLFFFIAKKKKIFFDNFKLKDIQPNRVRIGGVGYKIYGNKSKNKIERTLGYLALSSDLIDFFGKEKKSIFTDIKHILEFKKNLENNDFCDYDDSFVLIELDPLRENPFRDYFEKNQDKIDRNLVYKVPEKNEEQEHFWDEKRISEVNRYIREKHEEQERFWEEKRTSELYNYIHEKLKAEEARSHIPTHIPTPFQRLRDYYLQGKCPADPVPLPVIMDPGS